MRVYLLAIGLALGANVRSENFFQQLIARNSATTNDLFGIAARTNLAAAIGAHGTIVTSSDGLQWTNRASGVPANLYAVAVSPDRLCAVGAAGTIVVSTDGQSWSRLDSGTANDLLGVTILNNAIVAVGTKGTILLSTDGVSFQNRSRPVPVTLRAVHSANGLFAAVGDGGALLTSSDGSDWLDHDSGTFENLNAVNVSAQVVHFVGGRGTSGVYTQAQTKLLSPSTTNDLMGIALVAEPGTDLYEAVLDRAGNLWRSHVTSDTLKQETVTFCHANTQVNGIATFRGATFAVGAGGKIASTPIWYERVNPAGTAISSITYGQGNFVALSGDDTVLVSTNAEVWVARPFGFPNETHTKPFSTGIIYANGVFLAARGNEHFPPYELLSSTNALDWTQVPGFPTDQYITGLGFTPGEFLASAHSSIYRGADVYEDAEFFQHSPNGRTWIGERGPFRFTDEKLFQGVSFARAIDSTIYTSSNAVNWVAGPAGGQFLSVAENNLVSGPLLTQDGRTWTSHNFFAETASTNINDLRVAGRVGTYVATIDGQIGTLIGGLNSPIGTKWTPEFALSTSGNVTGLAFAQNRFVVTTSSGQIFQSEAIPVVLLIEQDGPNSLTILTTVDSLQLESAESLTNPIWKAAGTVTPAAPLKVLIDGATQLFFRAVPQ